MSIKLMHSAWSLDLPTGVKFVLVSLADQASDTGECWPSIETIAARTSMGVRTVQSHIKALEADGYLARVERPGRSTVYRLDPRRICTPADFAPPQKTAKTPAEFAGGGAEFAGAPADFAPINITEPSHNPKGPQSKAGEPVIVQKPDEVSTEVWESFLAVRKANRAPVTTVAMEGLRREAAKACMPIADVLRLCAERGWRGFSAAWVSDKNQHGAAGAPVNRQQAIEQRNATVADRWAANNQQPGRAS